MALRRVVMTEPSSAERWLWMLVLPVVGFVAFLATFAPRYDYAGHFLAGYGGSLGACWMVARVARGSGWATCAATAACVAFGALLEGSVFALAGFDDIDFGSQSLGAMLAGLALVQGRAGHPEADSPDGVAMLARNAYGRAVSGVSAFSLLAGTWAAFA